jgi:hypothetical protein
MKPGADYEKFVYSKFQRLFSTAVVKLNDEILGRESGMDREIDVSVRLTVDDTELLYIVQCKDWNSRVDINTLGAFAAVMQDVGAAKGFLLCTSGFYKTNHQYALARGIELVTIEDIQSQKWNTQIQIPFVYVRKLNDYTMHIELRANEALVELNRGRDLTISIAPTTMMVRVPGQPPITLESYSLRRVSDPALQAKVGVGVDIIEPNLQIDIGGVWVPVSELSVVLGVTSTRYLKYLTPTEYSHLRDHVRGTTLPLHVTLQGIQIRLDDTFVEMSPDAPAAFPGLWLEVEESRLIAGT